MAIYIMYKVISHIQKEMTTFYNTCTSLHNLG